MRCSWQHKAHAGLQVEFLIYLSDFNKTLRRYRVIKKSLCTWWLQYRKLQVMFKVSCASLQTFIEAPNCVLEYRVQYSTVHIPNVFCNGHLQIINCAGIVRMHWVRCTETFWSLRINESSQCKLSRNYIYMQWEPSSSMWTDGQTDRQDEANSLCWRLANAPQNSHVTVNVCVSKRVRAQHCTWYTIKWSIKK